MKKKKKEILVENFVSIRRIQRVEIRRHRDRCSLIDLSLPFDIIRILVLISPTSAVYLVQVAQIDRWKGNKLSIQMNRFQVLIVELSITGARNTKSVRSGDLNESCKDRNKHTSGRRIARPFRRRGWRNQSSQYASGQMGLSSFQMGLMRSQPRPGKKSERTMVARKWESEENERYKDRTRIERIHYHSTPTPLRGMDPSRHRELLHWSIRRNQWQYQDRPNR